MVKILIAEDDQELSQLFAHVLTKNGFLAQVVSNGKEALDERFNSQSSRWSHVLFKIAVELSILDHMLAAGFVELTAEEMRYIRNQCTNKIRKTKGLYRFEDALEAEKNAPYWD